MWRRQSLTAGGNVKWCNHFEKESSGFSKMLNTELLYDPAITLSYTPIEMKTYFYTETCT